MFILFEYLLLYTILSCAYGGSTALYDILSIYTLLCGAVVLFYERSNGGVCLACVHGGIKYQWLHGVSDTVRYGFCG